jgi:large subunit ribosomal protein L35Ae
MTAGKVIQFRRGRKTVSERHFLIEIEGVSNKEQALKFVGKTVVWKSPAGKEINGKVSASHGNKGVVRAIFERGLPGQAVTTKVEVNGDLKNPTMAKEKQKT